MFASWQLFFLSLIHNFKICVYASLLSLQIFFVVSFFIQTPFHSDGGLSWLKVYEYYAVVLMFRKIYFGDWVHDFLIWKHSCLTKIDCNKCLPSSTLFLLILTAQALAATHLLQSVSFHIILSFFMMHKTNLLRAVNKLKISDFNICLDFTEMYLNLLLLFLLLFIVQIPKLYLFRQEWNGLALLHHNYYQAAPSLD